MSPDLIFERALAIVDDEGLQALTMRRLASDLGVKAPSLYNHVDGKDDLVAGALRLMRAEVRAPSRESEDWRVLLAEIFSEYRRVLAAHPHMMPLAGRRLPGEGDSGLDYLVSRGFSADHAVELWQSLLALTVGFSLFTSGQAETDAAGLPAHLRTRAQNWHEDTYQRAMRAVMDHYDAQRASASPGWRGSGPR